MNKSTYVRRFEKECQLAFIFFLVLTPRALCGDQGEKIKRTFEIAITADTTSEWMNQKETMKGETRLRYTYERKGRESLLVIEEVELKLTSNGKPALEALMNRSRFRCNQNDKSVDEKIETASDRVKLMLSESFGTPIHQFEFDENGKELSRKNLAGPVATSTLIQKEMIANTRFFHAPFYTDQIEWKSDVEIGGAGPGKLASGKLVYVKGAVMRGEREVVVKVSGDLTLDQLKTEQKQIVGKHSVRGEQTYNTELREWTGGEWNVTMTLNQQSNGKQIALGTGKIRVNMKLLRTK